MTVRILVGDCRERLRELPDGSVQCVVTSPPYWGLRDYGTGSWLGGDPCCTHRSPTMRDGRNEDRATLAGSAATNMAQLLLAHRSACGKCGAVRVDPQFGMEPTYHEHVTAIADLFDEVRRVLKSDGTLWLNYGDSYATSVNGRSAADIKSLATDDRTFRDKPFSTIQGVLKPKDLCGIPWRVAFALQERGWWLRQDIIWSKPNPMPESIRDRCTKAHEYLFLLSKSERYYFDAGAIAEPSIYADSGRASAGKTDLDPTRKRNGDDGNAASFRAITETRNRRSVWTVPTSPFTEAHFATFPPALIEPCILAGCPEGGTVLDPFGGAGTTGLVADRLKRNAILIELNPAYADMAERRIKNDAGLLAQVHQEAVA